MPDSLLDQLNEADGTTAPAPAPRKAGSVLAQLDALDGRPEWEDARVPAAARLGDFLRTNALAARPYADVGKDAAARFAVDPAALKPHFDLELARARQAGEGESATEYFARRAFPLSSALGNFSRTKRYGDALESFRKGTATPEEIDKIARYERLQELDREIESTTGGALASAAAKAPAFLGEAYLGGAALRGLGPVIPAAGRLGAPATAATTTAAAAAKQVALTPFMPSAYLDQGAQAAVANPGQNAFQNYAPAVALAAVNNAVLGTLQKPLGGSVPTVAGRVLVKGGVGVLEQQAADAGTTALDRSVKAVTGYSLGLDTKYGVLGRWITEGGDHALKDATVQMLTYAAFAGVHEVGAAAKARPLDALVPAGADGTPRRAGGGEGPASNPVIEAFRTALGWMAGRGYSAKKAGETMVGIRDRLAEAMRRNPDLTRAEAEELFNDMPDGPVRDFAHSLARSGAFPETARRRAGLPEGTPAEPRKVQADPTESARVTARDAARTPDARAESVYARPPEPPATPEVQRAAPSPEPGGPAPGGFTTGSGSAYTVHPDGTTTRDKAARDTPGHEGDAGVKERSARTIYVADAGRAAALSTAGLADAPKARVVVKDGKATLLTWNAAEGRWGATAGGRDVPYSDRPAVGLHPVELWSPKAEFADADAYGGMHAGSVITKVDTPTTLPDAPRPADPLAVLGEDGVRAWAGRNGFPVRGSAETILRKVAASPSAWARLGLATENAIKSRLARAEAPPGETTPAGEIAPEATPGEAVAPVGSGRPPERAVAGDRPAVSMLDRMRERQARRAPVPVPEGGAVPRTARAAVEYAGEADPLRGFDAEAEYGRLAEAAATGVEGRAAADPAPGLSAREAHVLRERAAGRSHEQIAADPVMRKPDGTAYTRQRVKQVEAAARRKAGEIGSVAGTDHAAERLDRAIELHARGGRVDAAEFHHDPEAVQAVRRKADAADAAHERMVADFLREKERAVRTERSRGKSPAAAAAASEAAVRHGEGAAGVGPPAESPPGAARPPGEAPGPPEPARPGLSRADWLKQRAADRVQRERAAAQEAERAAAERDRAAAERRRGERADAEGRAGRIDAVALDHGGIRFDSEAKAHFTTPNEAAQYGVPLRVWKAGGRSLDQMAQELHAGGHLPDADVQTLVDHLAGRKAALSADLTATHDRAMDDYYRHRQAEHDAALHEAAAELVREDADFPFGANEPDPDGVRRFGGGPRGREGAITLPSLSDSRLADGMRVARDEWAKLGGEMFPATLRRAGPLADAMARLVSVPAFAQTASRYVMRAVFGPLQPAARSKFMAAFVEARLRYMNAATSIVGPDSPIKDAAEFNHIINNPAFTRFLERWRQVMVPMMEDHFREAQGMADTDPINSPSQIPNYPVNLKGVREDDPTTKGTVFAGGKGRLENVKQGRLGFAKRATGEAAGYETDPEAAIEHSLAHGAKRAAMAELYRTAEKTGQGKWGRPGQEVVLADGTPTRPIRDVDPPAGTQAAAGGETTFYVAEPLYNEFRDALQTDRTFAIPGITTGLRLATRGALLSTVEASFHSANLFTQLIQPRVVRHFVPNLVNAVINRGLTDAQLKHLSDLAEIGATKDRGFDAGLLWGGKWDPTAWASHLLDGVDSIMRLSMDQAFTSLAKDKIAENTTANRRRFLNSLGQYKRAGQSKLVTVLRDTGIGPFSVAATNYVVQGIRSLWLSPGMTATTPAAQARLRAHRLGKLAAILGGAAVLNYLIWGRWDGDDSVPLGGFKVGSRNGRTYYVDVGRLTGVSRGLRSTGGMAALEGARKGESMPAVVHQAKEDVTHAVLHPAMGPGFTFLYTANTGRGTLGQNLAGKAPAGGTQEWENIKAALKNVNPTIASFTGADHVKPSEPMPFFPLFGKAEPGARGVPLFGRYEERSPLDLMLRMGEPYVRSRKQMSLADQTAADEARLHHPR